MKTAQKITGIFVFILSLLTGITLFWAGRRYAIPKMSYYSFTSKLGYNFADSLSTNSAEIEKLERKAKQLRLKVDRLQPGNAFLIINTTNNEFSLIKNRRILREGKCSTGSFIQLVADSSQHWLFETPKGMLTVRAKIVDPVWRKPDWAFIEEGLQAPPANDPSRFERGVLGDYALSLGNGYLIHGTLYQRLIGMPVTHGCIRMSDEDLSEVYQTLQVGSKVFIY